MECSSLNQPFWGYRHDYGSSRTTFPTVKEAALYNDTLDEADVPEHAAGRIAKFKEEWNGWVCSKRFVLVGGLEHFLFSHILGISSSPIDFHIFQRDSNHQPDIFENMILSNLKWQFFGQVLLWGYMWVLYLILPYNSFWIWCSCE